MNSFPFIRKVAALLKKERCVLAVMPDNSIFCFQKPELLRYSFKYMAILLFAIPCIVLAQKPTSEFSTYNYKPTPQDRIILEVNHTGWLGMPKGLKEKPGALGANFQIFFDYPIKKSRVSFAWGLGLSSHNIHGPINLVYNVDSISGSINFTSIDRRLEPYKTNKIAFKLIELPVEFRIRTRTEYQFKLMVGAKVGYVLQTFRTIFDKDGKVRIYDIYGVNPIRYGVTMRMGWEQVHLTAFYALSEVFLKNKGQKGVIPFSFGIAYTPRLGLGRTL